MNAECKAHGCDRRVHRCPPTAEALAPMAMMGVAPVNRKGAKQCWT